MQNKQTYQLKRTGNIRMLLPEEWLLENLRVKIMYFMYECTGDQC